MEIPLLFRLGFVYLALWPAAQGPPARTGPCDVFYEALQSVPHVSLTLGNDGFISKWDGETYAGCQVEFETNDSTRAGIAVPTFLANPDTDWYDAGWRMRVDIGADGAGSGSHGIQREGVLCVVRWEQPAYVDDDGRIVQSETLRMWIQCRIVEPISESNEYQSQA